MEERRNDGSRAEVVSRMAALGFDESWANALLECGFISSPGDVSLVTRREMLASGFTRSDIRRIEVAFPSGESAIDSHGQPRI